MNQYKYEVQKICKTPACGAGIYGPSKYCVIHKVDAMKANKKRYQQKNK